jgi:arginyl-tRNA synthetase
LDMNWETGAYALYTWARIHKIIDEAWIIDSMDTWDIAQLLTSPFEFDLIKKISEFPNIITQTKQQLAPHLIAKYLFDLSQLVNSYYANIKILKAETTELKNARIYLLINVRETIKETMDLIWMHFLERM